MYEVQLNLSVSRDEQTCEQKKLQSIIISLFQKMSFIASNTAFPNLKLKDFILQIFKFSEIASIFHSDQFL